MVGARDAVRITSPYLMVPSCVRRVMHRTNSSSSRCLCGCCLFSVLWWWRWVTHKIGRIFNGLMSAVTLTCSLGGDVVVHWYFLHQWNKFLSLRIDTGRLLRHLMHESELQCYFRRPCELVWGTSCVVPSRVALVTALLFPDLFKFLFCGCSSVSNLTEQGIRRCHNSTKQPNERKPILQRWRNHKETARSTTQWSDEQFKH